MCVLCVWCVLAKKCITQQPTGVLGRNTYGRVAVDIENPDEFRISDAREQGIKHKCQQIRKKHNLNTMATTTPRYTVVNFDALVKL